MGTKLKENLINASKSDSVRIVALFVILAITLILGFFALGDDMQSLLRWYLALFLLGLAAMPLSKVLFGAFESKGYLFSKVIGLACVSYMQWLLSSLHIVKFSFAGCVGCLIAVAAIMYAVEYFASRGKSTLTGIYANISMQKAILYEEIFLIVLIICTWFLGLKIPANETERFMDFAFMKTMELTDYFPAIDTWAAGETINYYYFGQYILTFLSKLSFVGTECGYSLGMNTIMTCCFLFVFVIVKELLLKTTLNKKGAYIGGILSAMFVTLGGNFHYVVFYKIIPTIWDMLRIDGDKPSYWMADSTRYIGYIPFEETDRTIHEFPFYSFLIGDLHAHVIDIIVVLTVVAVVIGWSFKRTGESEKTYIKEILNPNIITIGFLISISSMSNYWDYPIYYVVCGSIVLAVNLIVYGNTAKTYIVTALQGILIAACVFLFNTPFRLKFDNMTEGIARCTEHSYFHQLIILWGIPTMAVILFVIYAVKESKAKCVKDRGILGLLRGNCISDVCVLLISLCGIGLYILPELIYVRDIYESGFPRANTMFKLAYEAFILLGASIGYIFVRLLSQRLDSNDISELLNHKLRNVLTVVVMTLMICCLGYAVTASNQWYGDISTWEYKGIDATSKTVENIGNESLAIEWIDSHLEGREVIVQSPGASYTSSDFVSVLTGHPTIAGWETHEWLWRNSYDYILERQNEVCEIYTGTDDELRKSILDKYNVSYVYIGANEYEKYGYINTQGILNFGHIVYTDNSPSYPNIIIQIDR